ncbi:MAG TPA: cytochrome c peroxidase [Polyangia bacterium]|jgi:cytochrome c peroxidase
MWRVWFLGGLTALAGATGCGKWADDLACGDQGCGFTKDEWALVQSLANVTKTPPRPDPSNAYLPIADWRTRALAPGADQDLDGTLVAPDSWAAVPEVNLGWRLYHEPALSGSLSNVDTLGLPAASSRPTTCGQINVSCASCHDPLTFGSDFTSVPNTVSIGAGWYDVNTQQTLNAARYPILYWNGRADTLWAQAAQVMESGVSMNGYRMKSFWVVLSAAYWADYAAIFPDAPAVQELASRLTAPAADALISVYKTQYTDLSSDADRQTVDRVHVNVAKAIAAYEWVLSSDGSPFDRYASGAPGAAAAFSPAAERGLKLFIGKASCIDCHNTPLFSDGKFHDIGIPQAGDHVPTVAACTLPATAAKAKCDCVADDGRGKNCLPIGAYAGLEKLAGQEFRRYKVSDGQIFDDNFAANPDATPPAAPALDPRWVGAWRTPSLRDVAMTAPYMHDGAFATLADVVWHYDQGGGEGNTIGTSELAPLLLTAQDREDLVAFLQTLTGVAGPPELIAPPPPSTLLGGPTVCSPPAPAAEVAP